MLKEYFSPTEQSVTGDILEFCGREISPVSLRLLCSCVVRNRNLEGP